MIEPIYDVLKVAIRSLSNKADRCRLLGYRPVVICCVVRRDNDLNRVLVVNPAFDHSLTILPQEGIRQKESLESASIRCLKEELNINSNALQFRKSLFLGKRRFGLERIDERDLQGSIRKIVGGGGKMIGKAYFGSLLIASSDIVVESNKAEVSSYQWLPSDQLVNRFKSNSPSKATILNNALTAFKTTIS